LLRTPDSGPSGPKSEMAIVQVDLMCKHCDPFSEIFRTELFQHVAHWPAISNAAGLSTTVTTSSSVSGDEQHSNFAFIVALGMIRPEAFRFTYRSRKPVR
jgi:hypothetical protein